MRAGSIVAGRFEVLGLAGHGGMGAVYRARDRNDGEVIALKVLRVRDPAAEQRLAREAQILEDLAHPSIVRHVAHGTTADGVLYLALEWLEGPTLSARLEGGALSTDEAITVAWHVADALDGAHRRGIVHRDVKPSNIVLGARGASAPVKLLDFGIAHLRASAQKLTSTGAVLGTPGYMAPEQARGEAAVDARADVFALGCVLFEALAGRPPFVADDPMALLLKVALEEAPRLRDVVAGADPALDELLARMLEKDPAKRPRHGGAVRDALGAHALEDARTEDAAAPLSMSERRWISAAVIRPERPPTAQAWETFTAAVERHGARLDRLPDGSAVAVVTMAESGAHTPETATDLAVRSARCALAARAILPSPSVALITGRSDRRGAIDDLLGHGVSLLGAGGVRVDDATRSLLETRFDVGEGGVLEGERDDESETRTLLRRPVSFVGRAREIAALTGLFEESEAGPVAQAAIVLGPPGIGKSRLRQEWLAQLARRPRPPRVWLARADDRSAGSPFGLVSRALRREAGILDGEPLAAQRARLEERFGGRLPGATRARTLAFVGELCNVPYPDDASIELRAARESPVRMADHVHRAFDDLVAAELSPSIGEAPEAEHLPRALVIVLEDVHWSDRPSVDLVDGLLRNQPEAPLFVLALGRPETATAFPSLWAERRAQTLRIGELLPKQSEALVRSVLGDAIDARALARMVERAAGNAFFLEELVRSFADGKGDQMPDTVLAMASARIEQLDPVARRVLRAGSLFGQTFWLEGVRALLGDSVAEAAIDAAIDAAVRREMLVRRRASRLAGQTEVAFRHALVRDAAAAMVADEALAPAHLRVAEWLERAGEHDLVTLADHFERGGDAARAEGAYRRAAAQALEGNDFAGAIERAERAVRCGAAGEALGVTRRIQAEALGWTDEHARSIGCGREAMQLLPRASAGWCAAAVEVIRSSATLMDHDQLLSAASEIGSLDPEEPRPPHVTAAARAATYLYGTDHRAEADWILERAERFARYPDAADATSLPWLHHARSWRAMFDGDPVASLRHEELSAEAFDGTGDVRNATYIRVGLGHAYRDIGAPERAEAVLRELLPVAERMGLHRVVRGAKHTLATVLSCRGAHPEARRLAEEAILGFVADGDIRMTGGARAELSRILAASGDLAGADAEARAAAGILDGLPSAQAYAFGVLAYVRLLAGKPSEALAAATSAMRILEEVGAIQDGELMVRLAYAEALYAVSAHGAESALAAVRDILFTRAARIKDVALRLGFLENIPENARTVALARSRLRVGMDNPQD